jgi:hypothetical protein
VFFQAPPGTKRLSVRQSSEIGTSGASEWSICGQASPYAVASSGSVQGATGCGARNLLPRVGRVST